MQEAKGGINNQSLITGFSIRYKSSFVRWLKLRLKTTFGTVKIWHSFLDLATPFDYRNYQSRKIAYGSKF
jgi:hypothetical protein